METTFIYSREKDIWCLLNKGKDSQNSPNPTQVYELLIAQYGEEPSEDDVSNFIDAYIVAQNVSIDAYITKYTSEWSTVADAYKKRAEAIFNVSLPHDITAHLTVNNRCPYSIADNMFYVPFPRETVRKTVMHELWHFYTWYGLGVHEEQKLGAQKYNDVKEALTVLLNVECADLLPDTIFDEGYPQHQELRRRILDIWQSNKDIKFVWGEITNQRG